MFLLDGARPKILRFLCDPIMSIRNLIDHTLTMSGSRKRHDEAFMPTANNVGRPPLSYTVEDAVKLVRYSS